jgi:hypothetical protein
MASESHPDQPADKPAAYELGRNNPVNEARQRIVERSCQSESSHGQQRLSDGVDHRHPCGEDKPKHDQKSAADSEKPGSNADDKRSAAG